MSKLNEIKSGLVNRATAVANFFDEWASFISGGCGVVSVINLLVAPFYAAFGKEDLAQKATVGASVYACAATVGLAVGEVAHYFADEKKEEEKE